MADLGCEGRQSRMREDCMILADGPSALVELCGVSPLERLLRTLQRCGITRATILSSTPEAISKSLVQASRPRARIDVRVCHHPNEPMVEQIVALWPKADPLLLIVRGDAVFDIRLVRLLLAQKSATALVDSSVPEQLEPLVASVEKTNAGKWSGAALLQYDWASEQRGSLNKAVRAGLDERSLAALDVAEQPFYDMYPSSRTSAVLVSDTCCLAARVSGRRPSRLRAERFAGHSCDSPCSAREIPCFPSMQDLDYPSSTNDRLDHARVHNDCSFRDRPFN